GARRTPGWSGEAVTAAGREQAAAWLRHNVVARDIVLVKASRGAALEHLADVLADDAEGGAPSR
ncbi:MAG: UDP-N-acetylmuramoyl-tripeptide--D-alanyl-D-alanine ligase, partial [Nocardioides sp.]